MSEKEKNELLARLVEKASKMEGADLKDLMLFTEAYAAGKMRHSGTEGVAR